MTEDKVQPFRYLVALIAILLLGLALRLAPWGQNRLLEDEALYAYWGLQIATGADTMLDYEPVDKPPLHPYTLAASFLLLGCKTPQSATGTECSAINETAARLPSLFASIVCIALVHALGGNLFKDRRVGLLAAFLVAVSPFNILFASTAFTDPLMATLAMGSLLAAAKGKPGVAGILAGLSAATKQQGLFFLPLIVSIAVIVAAVPQPLQPEALWIRRLWARRWMRFAVGFTLVAGGMLWWDLARQQRPGFFEQSLISYGALWPARLTVVGDRVVEWLQLVGSFWGSAWFSGLIGCLIAVWLVGGLAGWWRRWSLIDSVLGIFCACFLVLHCLVGFQVWDRYLLALVPLVALLSARALVALRLAIPSRSWRMAYTLGLSVAVAIALVGPVMQATKSELPLGGDHGAYDGIDQVASHLRVQAPPGSVLYHYWLGYHYRFYLYGAPLRLHWYPDLQDLAWDAYVYRREPRYIAFPSWRDSGPAVKALSAAGIRVVPDYETSRRDGSISFQLFRLEGP